MKAHIQAARRARKGIEQIREHLLCPTPESVSACGAPLTEAIRSMELLQRELGQRAPDGSWARGELRLEIERLRRELTVANALLRSAAEFHEGYGRLLRSEQDIEVDYSRTGGMTAPQASRRLVVHG